MNDREVHELLHQCLETELGGVEVYATALRCVQSDELREEWQRYSEQTARHVEIARGVLAAFGLDPDAETPGRTVLRHQAASLVQAMEMALEAGDGSAAQRVAAECVILAETKDHLNWALLGEVAPHVRGEPKKVLQEALDEVEDQEDEHLYHTTGWCRELWMDALGMKAVLPPPEEQRHVKTAIGAARAKHARDEMA